MTKIAIIAWGAMADVLYATPIVAQIRRQFPEAEITWLIRDKFAEVIETNLDIDNVLTFTLPTGYSSRQEAEHVMDSIILQDAQNNFDKVFDLQYWPRYNNFYENPTEDFISLRARNAGLDPADIIDRSIALNISKEDERTALKFILENIRDPDHYGIYPDFISVNHISYAASPVWSFENYTKLISILSERKIKCIFTGAPNEPIPPRAIDARGIPYMQWAEIIAMSNLWLGLDS